MPPFKDEHILLIAPGSQTTLAQLGLPESYTPARVRVPTRMFPAEKAGEWEPIKIREKKPFNGDAPATNGEGGANGTTDDILFEEDPESDEGAVYPLQSGRVTNWSCFFGLLTHVYNTLSPPFHTPILVVAQPSWTQQDHETLTQFFFEKFRTPAFALVDSATASTYAYNTGTSTVVDVGYDKCDITAITDFGVNDIGRGISVQGCGGETMTKRLMDLFQKKKFTKEMCEQLKRSPVCEVLPPGTPLPLASPVATVGDKGASLLDAGVNGAANGQQRQGGGSGTETPAEGENDGVLDVASIVTSGKTNEFLARKEKEKADKAAKKAGGDASNMPKVAKLPNSQKAVAIFNYNRKRTAEEIAALKATAAANAAANAARKVSIIVPSAAVGPKSAVPKSADPKSAEPKSAEPKSAEPKSAEPQPDAPPPADLQGDGAKRAEQAAADAQPPEAVPTEAKPAEGEASDPKPAEPPAAEPKPADPMAVDAITDPKPEEPAAEPKPEAPASAAAETAPAVETTQAEAIPAAEPMSATAATAPEPVPHPTPKKEREISKTVRQEIEVGPERFKAVDEDMLEGLADAIHRVVLSVPEINKRSELWDSLIILGNGSKIRGFKDALLSTLINKYLISPSSATIFTSELPSNFSTPLATGANTPQPQLHPPHHASGVNPLLLAATTASNPNLHPPGAHPHGSSAASTVGGANNHHPHGHQHTPHGHGQGPTSIRVAKMAEYFSEWKDVGFDEAHFLGAQIAAKVVFMQDQGASKGFMSRTEYNDLGPQGIHEYVL